MVGEFWAMLGNILMFYFPRFKLGRKEAIFGDINSSSTSVINTLLILAKQFLWKQKFGAKNLDEVLFINFMRKEIKLLVNIMEYKGRIVQFLKDWSEILDHFEIE